MGTLSKNVEIWPTTKYVHDDSPIELLADGIVEISLKADNITFAAIPGAIPFWTPYTCR